MGNRAENKKLIQAWVDTKLVATIDGEAARLGISRSELIVRACREFCDSKERAASAADIDALRAELQASFQAVALAIEKQPIAIQEAPAQALPEPEDEYETTWFGLYRKKR